MSLNLVVVVVNRRHQRETRLLVLLLLLLFDDCDKVIIVIVTSTRSCAVNVDAIVDDRAGPCRCRHRRATVFFFILKY
jgi:hypothetical protein